MRNSVRDKSKMIETLFGILFLCFAAGVFFSLLGKNSGSAIWMTMAASNSVTLMVWADMKRKYEALRENLKE